MRYNKKYPVSTLLIFVAGLVFLPGLTGIFLLDDFPNLSRLNEIDGLSDWRGILSYTFNGISSSLGRPISLFSFALQAGAWPDDAFQFKVVSLLIHILNGILIYLLSYKLLSIGYPDNKNTHFYSLITSIIWLIHPMQVSTVLYVVQRMTELSTLFTLAGLILYLKGRLIFKQQKHSWLWMTIGIGVGLLFGILSKENAILLCAFILVMEWTILRSIPRPRYWNVWASIFLVLPLLALIIYLTPDIAKHISTNYPTRTFNATTRLLTEARILFDYILNILMPRPASFGLFNSDYTVSQNLFNPVSTFWTGLFIIFLLVLSILIRKKYPCIAFGILCFFAGHSLESTVVNLELYFEHRNYFPIFGIVFAIVCGWLSLKQQLVSRQYIKGKISLYAGMFIWILFLAVITFNETRLWGNPVYQASIWGNQHPNSYRAQGHYVELLTKLGEFETAKNLLERNTHSFKNDSTQILHWLDLKCYNNDIQIPEKELLIEKLKVSLYFNASLMILDEIIKLKEEKECADIENHIVETSLLTLLNNTNFQSDRVKGQLYVLLARINTVSGKYSDAVQNYSYAYNLISSIDILLSVADIHLGEKNKQWFVETIEAINLYCDQYHVKCMRYKKDIERFNLIKNKIAD